MRVRLGSAAFAIVALIIGSAARAVEDDGFICRVVDVGAGHCAAVRVPSGSGSNFSYFIFDAGNRGWDTRAAIAEIIPPGSTIELLILSHNDQDHLGEVPWICSTYDVVRCLHPGDQAHDPRPSGPNYATFREAHRAIDDERARGMVEHDFSSDPVPHGTTYPIGEGSLTILAGWDRPPAVWGARVADNTSKRRNSISICARLEFEGRSILFTGDAFGRWDGDPPEEPAVATERYLIDHAGERPIGSDVFIAPHHGADNGASLELMRAVSPLFVVYPAGSSYAHPRWTTVVRARDAGVPLDRQFRTDLGDSPGAGEWRWGTEPGGDRPGDDHVDIYIIRRPGRAGWVDLWYADEEAPDDASVVNFYANPHLFTMDASRLLEGPAGMSQALGLDAGPTGERADNREGRLAHPLAARPCRPTRPCCPPRRCRPCCGGREGG